MVNTMAMVPSMAFGLFEFLRWGRCTILYLVACLQQLPVCSRKHKVNGRKNVVNKMTMLPSKAFGLVDFLRWGCCTILYPVACLQQLPVCSRKHKMNGRKKGGK